MFRLGNFLDKSPTSFWKILKLPSFYSGNFEIFKNELGQFIPNMFLLVKIYLRLGAKFYDDSLATGRFQKKLSGFTILKYK